MGIFDRVQSSLTKANQLDQGKINVPAHVGEAYNKVTKLGSHIGTDINRSVTDYKILSEEVMDIQNSIRNFDVSSRLEEYARELIFGPDNVPLPPYPKTPIQIVSDFVNRIENLYSVFKDRKLQTLKDGLAFETRYHQTISADYTNHESGFLFRLSALGDPSVFRGGSSNLADSAYIVTSARDILNRTGSNGLYGGLANAENSPYVKDSVFKVPLPEASTKDPDLEVDPKALPKRVVGVGVDPNGKKQATLDFEKEYGDLRIPGDSWTPQSLTDLMTHHKIHSGYKNIQGFSIATDHAWELTLKPYIDPLDPSHAERVLTPNLPKVDMGGKVFDYNEWLPVMDYTYNIGGVKTDELSLFGDDALKYFSGYGYDNTIELNILDDRNLSLHKYFSHYINQVYDPVTKAIAPYHDAAWELTLYIYRGDKKLNLKFSLIVTLGNWNNEYIGNDGSSPDSPMLTVEFSVIGVVNKFSNTESTKNSRDEIGYNFNDVTLLPDIIVEEPEDEETT